MFIKNRAFSIYFFGSGEKRRKLEGSHLYTFRAGRFNHRRWLASLSTPNERRPVKCFAERLDVNFSPECVCGSLSYPYPYPNSNHFLSPLPMRVQLFLFNRRPFGLVGIRITLFKDRDLFTYDLKCESSEINFSEIF